MVGAMNYRIDIRRGENVWYHNETASSLTPERRHCVFDLDNAVNGYRNRLDGKRRSSCLD
jgi:hypothetical protein